MNQRTPAGLLTMLLVAALAAAPAVSSDAQTIELTDIELFVGPGAPGVATDGSHEARCGGLAPLDSCSDTVFVPEDATTLALGAAVSPGFTGYLVITLETPPFHIEITCEIIVGGVGPAACATTGGQGVLLGALLTMTVEPIPIAVGEYEIWLTVA